MADLARRRGPGGGDRAARRRGRARPPRPAPDILVLGDRRVGPGRAPIPSLLAVAAVHHALVRARAAHALLARGRLRRAARGPPRRLPGRLRRRRRAPVAGGRRDRPRAGQGPAEGDVQDGRLDRLRLPRRAGLRGDRARAGADRAPLRRHAVQARRARAARARARGARAPRAHVPARPAGCTAGGATASATAGTRTPSPRCSAASGGATSRPSDARRAPRRAARPARLPRARPDPAGGRRARDRDHEALRHRRDVARLDLARGARVARAGDERDRRALEHRRGRRGPGALHRRAALARSSRWRPGASA